MLELGLKVLLSYLLGSLVGSLVLRPVFGGVDIREMGSGNPGSTNALRTQGKGFAFWVILIDLLKGVVAVWLIPLIAVGSQSIDPMISRDWLAAACGAAVVVGHCYPLWFSMKGGKGAATLVGVYAVLAPKALVVVLVVWMLALLITRYVGVATMAGSAAAPVYLLAYEKLPWNDAHVAFAIALALFIVYTHRMNIQRMRAGTEERDWNPGKKHS